MTWRSVALWLAGMVLMAALTAAQVQENVAARRWTLIDDHGLVRYEMTLDGPKGNAKSKWYDENGVLRASTWLDESGELQRWKAGQP